VNASVIVTTYNRPDTLIQVLKALAYQTHLAGEVLIADDGSTDDTRLRIRQLQSALPYRLAHVWHADEGFRAAKIRNDAVRLANEDYIILLDGDCIPTRHFIKDHLVLARRGCFFQGKRVLVKSKIVARFDWPQVNSAGTLFKYVIKGGLSNTHHVLRCAWLPSFPATGISGTRSCNMGLFKSDFMAVNGFNEEFTGWGREDSEFVVRLFNFGLKRRTHSFMAICFHLWHIENDKAALPDNDLKLKKTIDSKIYYCTKGINKSE